MTSEKPELYKCFTEEELAELKARIESSKPYDLKLQWNLMGALAGRVDFKKLMYHDFTKFIVYLAKDPDIPDIKVQPSLEDRACSYQNVPGSESAILSAQLKAKDRKPFYERIGYRGYRDLHPERLIIVNPHPNRKRPKN